MAGKAWDTSIRKKPTTGIKMTDINKLKAKAMGLEPIVRIGKAGLTESVLIEIKKQLKQKNLIKIKVLKSFAKGKEKKTIAELLSKRTGSLLVHNVGFIIVLAKKSKTI